MRLLLAVLGAALCAALPLQAAAIPPPPADGILDDARLLDQDARAEVHQLRDQLKEEFDVDLYIAAYTLLSGDLNDHARALRDAWLTTTRGMVVVYRRGNQELAFSSNEQAENFIPPAKLYSICNSAVAVARSHEDPRDRIVAAVNALADGIKQDLSHRDPKRDGISGDVINLIASLALAILILGAIGYAIVSKLANRRHELEAAIRFPEVVVGERLGAAFGGGTVAELGFEKSMSGVSPPAQSPTPRQ